MITQAEIDHLNAVIADPIKRERLRELVEKARVARIQIEDLNELVEGLAFSVNLDLKMDVSLFKRLVTKVKNGADASNLESLVDEVLNEKEASRKY